MHSLRVVQGGIPDDGKKRFLTTGQTTSANQGKRAMEGIAAFVSDLEAGDNRLLYRKRQYDPRTGKMYSIALKRDDGTLTMLLAYDLKKLVVTFVATVRTMKEQRRYGRFRKNISEEAARYQSLLG